MLFRSKKDFIVPFVPYGTTYGEPISQDFSPTDIAGISLWLDASQIVGLADSNSIQAWMDMSGQGNDVSQTTGADQPTYQTNELNGLPVVRFDGINDTLTRATISTSGNTTIFLVLVTATLGSDSRLIFSSLSSSNVQGEFAFHTRVDNTVFWSRRETASSAVRDVTSQVLSDTTAYLFSTVFNSGAYFLSVNGTENTTDTPNNFGTGDATAWKVGSGDGTFWNGDMAEIIVYDSALSTGNRQSVESYLATKYNITLP